MTPADPVAVALMVGRLLDQLGIRYVVGGSVASSLMGEPRSTLDVDMMIECDSGSVRKLVAGLKDEFYVDESEALRAVANESTFNAIHLSSSLKIDFFIAERSAFARDQLARRHEVRIAGSALKFYAPEDLVVRKLMWFKIGGEASERQWRDILGILRINPDLDLALLRHAAQQAGVSDLLERALEAVR